MLRSKRFWVGLCIVVFAGFLLLQFWHWEVERVEVPPGKFLVRISRWGQNLPEETIVAPDSSYKGVMLEVLPEGRHFLNPFFWAHEEKAMVTVPAAQCLVLTRKYGQPISAERLERGDILAQVPYPVPDDQQGQEDRGIVRNVLMPGSYRINPYAYDYKQVPAVEIRVDQVGVRTVKVGKDPRELGPLGERSRYSVPEGYRGVQETPVRPGMYYLNPYVETITPIEVRSHRVELEDIEFPSRDGFILKPHVLVEYAVKPDKAPELLVRLADEGQLHQQDATPAEQAQNEILQKVILPYIRGYARIEGSNFNARDFIVTDTQQSQPKNPEGLNNREALQKALEAKVKPRCEELGIEVRAVTLATLVPPEELATQISERELALVEQAKNKVRLGQYKAEQELRAKEALKQQATEKVQAETRLVQTKTKTDQLREVEESRLKQELANAQLRLDAARLQAQAKLTKGKADAAVINLQNEAEVVGLRQAIQGFSSVQQFAQYHVLSRIGPAVKEIFASDTSEFARMLAGYLSPPPSAPMSMPALAADPVAENRSDAPPNDKAPRE